MTDPLILESREITLRFGGLEALNQLSFAIPSQRIVSIIGPNGAGKTTLLNAITGIYTPDSGDIFFPGSRSLRAASFSGCLSGHQPDVPAGPALCQPLGS